MCIRDRSRTGIVDYITHLITGADLPAGLSSSAFTVLTNNINNTYTFDLELESGQEFPMSSQFGKLITICGDKVTAGSSGKQQGCFIVDKATVEMGFFKDNLYNKPLDTTLNVSNGFRGEGSGWDNDLGEPIKRRIGVYIKNITQATTKTCLRSVVPNSLWRAFDFNTNQFFTPVLNHGAGLLPEDASGFENQQQLIVDQFTESGPFTRFIGRLQGFNFNGEDSEGRSRFSCLDGLGCLAGSDGAQFQEPSEDNPSGGFNIVDGEFSNDSDYDLTNVILGIDGIFPIVGSGGQLLGTAQMRRLNPPFEVSNAFIANTGAIICLLYTSPSPRDS